jgi:hypothetical protein
MPAMFSKLDGLTRFLALLLPPPLVFNLGVAGGLHPRFGAEDGLDFQGEPGFTAGSPPQSLPPGPSRGGNHNA